ncbi:MAG: diguanylate cyclase [Candidatus Thiodiazotropha taylori]|nr:diguanylate cyclase [Candidatus Thiodiazotropha taylori]
MRFTIQTKLFLSHFAAIILVSGSVGSYFYHSAIENLMHALQSRLMNSASLISSGLRDAQLDQIREEKDMASPNYQLYVNQLRSYVKTNPDIAFIYVMRKVDDKAAFVVDSDMQEPALPGEIYEPDIDTLMEGFLRPSVDQELVEDRWGVFLSGYSPIEAGNDDYLIGIDMRADEVKKKFEQIRLAGFLSLALSVILAMIFSRLLSQNFTRRISHLTTRFARIAPDNQAKGNQGNGDEIDQLARAFDLMSARLEVKQQQIEANQIALCSAHDDLEERVENRTMELVQTNQKLLKEIAERKHVEQMLEETSRIDYLTNSLNRRAMTRRLDQVVSQTERGSESFCIILLDVDHFKQINDNYGHDIGDQVLTYIVKLLKSRIREADELGRWGGEEFMILCPETQLAEARLLAQRLCDDLSASPMTMIDKQLQVTASFGVSLYQPGEVLGNCLKRTDYALYEAKAKGRNCVVVADQ